MDVDFKGGLLWFQFAYSVWQFIRVAKFCRVPYALLAHTVMWLIGRWGRPFAYRSYLVLEQGRTKFFIPKGNQDQYLGNRGSSVVEELELAEAPHLRCLHLKAADYKLCGTALELQNSFVWNYLRDDPDCFAIAWDLLWPGFAILDRISPLNGLQLMCQGDYIPGHRRTRFLAVPDRGAELNQNFLRILSIVPMMAQAKGYDNLSLWVSIVVIVIDQLSLLFNKLWDAFKSILVFLFKIFMLKTKFQPQTRSTICTIFSTLSTRLNYSDVVRMNFIRVNKGDMVYTASPFNLADFERIETPHFETVRKPGRPYSKEEFGTFGSGLGDEHYFDDRASVRSYEFGDCRLDVIFADTGQFFNYVNNVAVHLGYWKNPHDESGSYNNILDLLHIMEQMQMLPIKQNEEGRFQSLHYNMFLAPGSSPRDLTFLVAKNKAWIGL